MRLIIKTFTGKSIELDIDPTITVSELKVKLATHTSFKGKIKTAIAYKGHELRDHRQISHYGISQGDTLNIRECRYIWYIIMLGLITLMVAPPSSKPRITLEFQAEDGSYCFSLSVPSDASIAQIKKAILYEEKAVVSGMKISSTDELLTNDNLLSLLSDLAENEVIVFFGNYGLIHYYLVSANSLSQKRRLHHKVRLTSYLKYLLT